MKKPFVSCGIVIALFSIKDAYAYLDPATGSLLLQFLVAGVATVVLTTRLYWKRLKAFLFRRSQKAEAPPETVANGKDAR